MYSENHYSDALYDLWAYSLTAGSYTTMAERAETAICPTVKLSYKKGLRVLTHLGGLTPCFNRTRSSPLHTLVWDNAIFHSIIGWLLIV